MSPLRLVLVSRRFWPLVGGALYRMQGERSHFSPLSKRGLNEVTTWGTYGECQAYIQGRHEIVSEFARFVSEAIKRDKKREEKSRQEKA